MVKVIITERVQEALTTVMYFNEGCTEWCFRGHEKEHLGIFGNGYWIVDTEEEIKFLKMIIEIYTKDLSSDEDWGYKQDCAAIIRAVATLIEEIINTLW